MRPALHVITRSQSTSWGLRACRAYSGGIIERGDYATLTEADVSHFHSICDVLQPEGDDMQELERYNNDWTGQFRGQSRLVLKPSSTEQVSAVMAHCHERKIAVVPQGGNTGLVGGSNPLFDEVVLSLERMDAIIGFDEMQGVVQAEAGVILQNLDDWLGDNYEHLVPIDLGARGTCQVGGNVSTHAVSHIRSQRQIYIQYSHVIW